MPTPQKPIAKCDGLEMEMAVTANEIPTPLRHRTADSLCPQHGEATQWGAVSAGIGMFGRCARGPGVLLLNATSFDTQCGGVEK